MEKKKKLIVLCPGCKKEVEYYQSSFRPFCSQACSVIDLAEWGKETYRIAAVEQKSESDFRFQKEDFPNEDLQEKDGNEL